MKRRLLGIAGMLLLASSLILGGCAAEQQTTRRYLFPRPPDQPRLEWIKSYYSQNSFPKSGFTLFLEGVFGEPEPITFEKPIDLKSNGEGMVYVADVAIPGVVVYDLNAGRVELWRKGDDPDKSLAIVPYYLSLDRDNNIYVVGTGQKRIYVLDRAGAVTRYIDYSATVKSPGGILVDSDSGRIYLVDVGDSKVAVFDMSGKHIFSFGKFGTEDGEFNRPVPIALNHKGELLVGDVMNARVQFFNKEGKFLRKFGQRGDGGAEFQIIKGLSVDSEDNVYVTDGKANQVKIFSAKGEYLLAIGSAYSVTKSMREVPGGFLLPQGIFIDKNNYIYIADQANVRFQVWRYLGDTEAKPGQKTQGNAK